MSEDSIATRGFLWLATGLGVIVVGAIIIWKSPLLSANGEDSPWNARREAVAMLEPQVAQLGDAEMAKPPAEAMPTNDLDPVDLAAVERRKARSQGLINMLTIFAVSIFVGFEVITKVPPTLHTPLMSGSNAVSGITIVGAVIVAASDHQFAAFLAMFAVLLAAINVVGGFLVTHRMLAMFKK